MKSHTDAYDLLANLSSILSHQLRTPPTAIKWIANLMLMEKAGPLTEQQKELVNELYENNERTLSIIDDMLYGARIHLKHKFEIMKIPTDLIVLLNRALDKVKGRARRNNVTVELDKTIPAAYPITLDAEKIQQVFTNLLDNAIKYSPEGETVTVSFSENDNAVQFVFKDKGIGIPKDEQEHICEQFFRASNARKLIPDGTGLGLFVCKHILEGHGGLVSLESEEGKGTTFVASIPDEKLTANSQ